MKELTQAFSRWYNKRHERYGTLWAERFRSAVVEGPPGAVLVVAAYVDLNSLRAGLVTDPKDYRFCGYAEALARSGLAREGLRATTTEFIPSSGRATLASLKPAAVKSSLISSKVNAPPPAVPTSIFTANNAPKTGIYRSITD